jgi:hypothetical protein
MVANKLMITGDSCPDTVPRWESFELIIIGDSYPKKILLAFGFFLS